MHANAKAYANSVVNGASVVRGWQVHECLNSLLQLAAESCETQIKIGWLSCHGPLLLVLPNYLHRLGCRAYSLADPQS